MGSACTRATMMSQQSATTASGSPNNYDDEDAHSCWICLDDGSEEPLRRECACRGAAGWSHLSCLSDYAMTQSRDALLKIVRGACHGAAEDIGLLNEPWRLCSNCIRSNRVILVLLRANL